jgi:hypothetical protein
MCVIADSVTQCHTLVGYEHFVFSLSVVEADMDYLVFFETITASPRSLQRTHDVAAFRVGTT